MKVWLIILAVVVIACIGSVELARRFRKQDRVQIDTPSADLQSAIRKAKDTLPHFIERLQDPNEGDVAFAIQARFVEGSLVEHIWVSHVTYVRGHFEGILAEQPFTLKAVSQGQFVTVERKNVSDWMIKKADGSIEGGFTQDALRHES
jgi:uncharacterized protein YegJ (DUF2314 family)